MLRMVPVSKSLWHTLDQNFTYNIETTYLKTRASLSRTRRTKAKVRPLRESSGRVAPPGKALTRVVVCFVVKFVEKIAYVPLCTSARYKSITEHTQWCTEFVPLLYNQVPSVSPTFFEYTRVSFPCQTNCSGPTC